MEVGKLKSSACPIFYFIIDPIAPDAPSATRLQHYFVVTHIDSYVEAFNFICRTLCVPPSDSALRRWHSVYCNVFGSVSFESFARSVQTLPTQHFHLEQSESAARLYVATTTGGASGSDNKRVSPPRHRGAAPSGIGPSSSIVGSAPTALLMHPTRNTEDAVMELHRLRAELQEAQGQLRTEKNRQQLHGLSDTERTALLYRLEQAQKDLEAEKLKSKEMNDRLREQLMTLQQRMDALCAQHESALNDMAQSERQNLLRLEQEFLKREQEMQNEFETNMRERDRKMGKTMTHATTLEQQFEQASRELERLREENIRLQLASTQAKSERDAEESQFKRLRLQFEAQESHRQGLERDLKRFEEEQRRMEGEALRWKQEAARWKREAERFHQFTSSLQGELKELDDESATTAELLRRKVMRERHDSQQRMSSSYR